jgi:hypothetical protein
VTDVKLRQIMQRMYMHIGCWVTGYAYARVKSYHLILCCKIGLVINLHDVQAFLKSLNVKHEA